MGILHLARLASELTFTVRVIKFSLWLRRRDRRYAARRRRGPAFVREAKRFTG